MRNSRRLRRHKAFSAGNIRCGSLLRDRRTWRPQFEQLEQRALLATVTVNCLDEVSADGNRVFGCDSEDQISFRKALAVIHDRSAVPVGVNTIEFDLPGSGPHIVHGRYHLEGSSVLGVAIDGTTEPDYQPGQPSVVFVGGPGVNLRTPGHATLNIQGPNVTIKGLEVTGSDGNGNFTSDAAIAIEPYLNGNPYGAVCNTIEENVLSSEFAAISVFGTEDNVIRNNQIVGDYAGILLENSTRHTIQGNRIGPGGQVGIRLFNSNHNTIGYDSAPETATRCLLNPSLHQTPPGEESANVLVGSLEAEIKIETHDKTRLNQRDSIPIATNNAIRGNFIGINRDGTVPGGDAMAVGVLLKGSGCPDDSDAPCGSIVSNFIGGDSPESRNIISGNLIGIKLEGYDVTANLVTGNYIGTDPTGMEARSNGTGVHIVNAPRNIIGGPEERGNVISGNTLTGIRIEGSAARENTVAGNLVGTNSDGTALLRNAQSNDFGIAILSAENIVYSNVISGNHQAGVALEGVEAVGNELFSNFIGTNIDGTARLENSRSNKFGVSIGYGASRNIIGGDGKRNLISGNLEFGVTIFGSGTTQNQVLGNYIGPDISGERSLLFDNSNQIGVIISEGSSRNYVGNLVIEQFDGGDVSGHFEPGARNVISGNAIAGVVIIGAGTKDNRVFGNYIGTNRDGTARLDTDHNHSEAGVLIEDGAQENIVGHVVEEARNIISGNDDTGVWITDPGTDNNKIIGNYIGTDRTGTKRLSAGLLVPETSNRSGVYVNQGAQNNFIGDTTDGSGNVISGNLDAGVIISGNGTAFNKVIGNFIGTDASGTKRLSAGLLSSSTSNQVGVLIQNGAENNSVGLPVVSARNVISGNAHSGVGIRGEGTTRNFIRGNFIGTDKFGTSRLLGDSLSHDNSNLFGVYVSNGAVENFIGGMSSEERNVISGNLQGGVEIVGGSTNRNQVLGNYIGTDRFGSSPLGNGMSGVEIFSGGDNIVSGNVISANSNIGVAVVQPGGAPGVLTAANNQIVGNTIGTDANRVNVSFPSDFANGTGILIDGAGNTTIGRSNENESNFIATNNADGIVARNAIETTVIGNEIRSNGNSGLVLQSAKDTIVQGNYIAFNQRFGVLSINGTRNSTIGGNVSGQENRIIDNMFAGINVHGSSQLVSIGNDIEGHRIGLRCEASQQVSHSTTRFSNNDTHVVDIDCSTTPVPVPRVTNASQFNSTLFEGQVIAIPNTSGRLEIFSGPPCDADGSTDVETFIGSANLTTDANGIANYRQIFPVDIPLGQGIMTAYTPDGGSTSDFSQCAFVDTLAPIDELSILDASVAEGDNGFASLEVTIVRRNVSNQTVQVELITSDGTAVAPDDYIAQSGQIVEFPPGSVLQTATIPIRGDQLNESDETFTVTLANPASGAVIGEGTAIATIINDDSNTISILDAQVLEPENGVAQLEFTVRLANPTGQPITAELNTVDGTATVADNDYLPIAGQVITFNPGDPLTQIVTVEVIGDSTVEADETLSLLLSNVTGPSVTIADSEAEGIIFNELQSLVSVSDAISVPEGTDVEFVVSLSSPNDTPVTVELNTVDGTATVADGDYDPLTQQFLTFDPGEVSKTVTVHARADASVEYDEFFSVALSNVSGFSVAIDDTTANAVILEEFSSELSILPFALDEGTGSQQSFGIPISLSRRIGEAVTIEYTTHNGTASNGDFTSAVNEVVTIPPDTLLFFLPVSVDPDDVLEDDEQFSISISNAIGPRVSIGRDTATVTIRNDDTPSYSVGDVTVTEGDEGITAMVFDVTLSSAADRPLEVRIDTIDGSAQAHRGDYLEITNLVWRYEPGDPLSFPVQVNVAANRVTQSDRTLRLQLSTPTSPAAIANASGLGTIVDDDLDTDGDGISDELEDLAPGAGDANNDMILDRDQASVASFPNIAGGAYITLIATGASELANVTPLPVPDPANNLAGLGFPFGFVEFDITGVAVGQSTIVEMLSPAVPEAHFQFGRESINDPSDRSFDFSFDGTVGAEILTDRSLLHFNDGSRGDLDLAVDGNIAARVGAAIVTGADVSLTASALPATIGQGQPFQYELAVTNEGTNVAEGVVVVDTLPGGVEFLGAAATQGTIAHDGQTVSIDIGDLAPSATVTIQIDVRAPADPGIGANAAIVTVANGDPHSENNATTTDTLIQQAAIIRGQKFQDDNGNGIRDPGEMGLNGVAIELIDSQTDQVVATTVSRPIDRDGDGTIDAETERGLYEFSVLVAGTYELQEQSLPGFTQTFPSATAGVGGVGVTDRLSISDSGAEGNSASLRPAISADGRFVAFQSTADNLVPGDTNNRMDVFVYDRQAETIERVSVPDPRIGDTESNQPSELPAISADGRYVVFVSRASNLDLNGSFIHQVYVRDRQAGTTKLVSADENGVPGNFLSGKASVEFPSHGPDISGDGRFVAFTSQAENLDADTSVNLRVVYVKDLVTAAVERVSVPAPGVTLPFPGVFAFNPAISSDGRFVAYMSSSRLTQDKNDNSIDVFVFDRDQGTTERIRANTGVADDQVYPAISHDGRYVAFPSSAADLITGDTNGETDIFVHDRQTNNYERVSVGLGGTEANGRSSHVAISGDGRYVTFSSAADNLVPNDTNGGNDVFIYDRETGETQRVSIDSDGNQVTNPSSVSSIAAVVSASGQSVAFGSNAVNLVPDDSNDTSDVFVRGGETADAVHRVTIVPGDTLEGQDFGNQGSFVFDYGDAPESYGATLSQNGPRHLATGPFLGTLRDAEANGQSSFNSFGDDRDGVDDEDGVSFTSVIVPSEAASIRLEAGTDLMLDAWLDFNRNGQFDHPAEQIFAGVDLAGGSHELTFDVPSEAIDGTSVARFRVSSSGGLGPLGLADDGEVEDYRVTIARPQADLTLAMQAPTAVAPGAEVVYSVTVANNGPQDAQDVRVVEMLPFGTRFVSQAGCSAPPPDELGCVYDFIPVGESRHFEVTALVEAGFRGTLTSIAEVSSLTLEAAPGDETARADTRVTEPTDLSIALVDDQDPVVAGSNLTFMALDAQGVPTRHFLEPAVRDSIVVYSATVTNHGPLAAADVIVLPSFPAGFIPLNNSGCDDETSSPSSCSLGTLAVGETLTIQFAVQLLDGLLGTFDISVDVSSATPDSNPTNNADNESTTVVEHADLVVLMDDQPDPVLRGGEVTYRVTVQNRGPSAAENVVLTNFTPLNATLRSVSGCLNGPSTDGVCSLGLIPATATREIFVQVQFDPVVVGLVENEVKATSITREANPGDESATEGTTIIAGDQPPTVSLSNSAMVCGAIDLSGEVILNGVVSNTTANSALVNWGDGSPAESVASDAMGNLSAKHGYATGGIYSITVTVSGSVGTATATTEALITGVGLHAGILQVIGTESDDHLNVSREGTRLVSRYNFRNNREIGRHRVNLAEVAEIMVILCDGEDHVYFGPNFAIPSLIDTGAGESHVNAGDGNDIILGGDDADHVLAQGGNDFVMSGGGVDHINTGLGDDIVYAGTGADQINTGQGNDIVVADDGNDHVNAGPGRDVIIGGPGFDRINGGSDDDILIPGTTSHDSDLDALLTIQREWLSDRSFSDRRANLFDGADPARDNGSFFLDRDTVQDDVSPNHVTTGGGQDWRVSFSEQAGATMFQNRLNVFDVNDEGIVSIVDALVLVDQLRDGGSLDLQDLDFDDLGMYVDVNGDNLLTLGDALNVVRELRETLVRIGEDAFNVSDAAVEELLADGEIEYIAATLDDARRRAILVMTSFDFSYQQL